MFHVKRLANLLAKAKAAKQRIEQILYTGAAGNSIDRQSRDTQFLGDQHGVDQLRGPRQRLLRLGQ
jgi:hypothetical protein